MTEANFDTIFIGVESPDEAVLQRAHKRQNVASPLADSLKTINANGLSIIGSFILGLDGETAGAGDRIADFCEAVNLPVVMMNMLFPLFRTRLWHRLRQEGRLREALAEDWAERKSPEMEYYTQMFFEPSRPEAEVVEEYFRMVDRLLEPSAFLARAYRSILAMRPTRSAMAAKKGETLPPTGPPHREAGGIISTTSAASRAWPGARGSSLPAASSSGANCTASGGTIPAGSSAICGPALTARTFSPSGRPCSGIRKILRPKPRTRRKRKPRNSRPWPLDLWGEGQGVWRGSRPLPSSLIPLQPA